jgi:hypothetical protein
LILVIGGRSKIGAALLGELLGRGQQVRALVRAGEPAGRLPAEAEPVTGDLADEGSLVTAMAGVEKVFLLSSPHPDAVSWHRNAIDAARRTQVQLLVRSSILGADRESPAEHRRLHGGGVCNPAPILTSATARILLKERVDQIGFAGIPVTERKASLQPGWQRKGWTARRHSG